MDRIGKISKHLGSKDEWNKCPFVALSSDRQDAEMLCPFSRMSTVKPLQVTGLMNQGQIDNAVLPPVVHATIQLQKDPINFLLKSAQVHPEMFMVDRGKGEQYVVISDPSMFEDILTYDSEFGNPVTAKMSVNKTIFEIDQEQLERHEQNTVGNLRKFLLNNSSDLADVVAHKASTFMESRLGDQGVMDLRELGETIFWPMTEALFGDNASARDHPELLKAFENIDDFFGKALRGHKIPEVQQGVSVASKLFKSIVEEAKSKGKPMAPLLNFYDDITKSESSELTGKFATAALWGGSGNSVPSTVWAFGMVLDDPRVKAKAYAEVDGSFANEPNAQGHFDMDKLQYLSAVLKETLRMKTYSVAWRQAQTDTVLTSSKGTKFLLKKGTLIGLHFAMRHMDPKVHDQPDQFRPERFLGSGTGLSSTLGGHPYAWIPFSAGRHKCSGYSLAMLEIPLVMAIAFRKYDMKLLDPLPGMNFKSAFGVIGPDNKPVRVRYSKRST